MWGKDFLFHVTYLLYLFFCRYLFVFSTGFTSVSASLLFQPSINSSLCTASDSISSNIDQVLSINLSANVFVSGEFIVHHKDRLTHSGGTDRPGEVCHNFSQTNLLRWLSFLLRFSLQWFSIHWEILITLLSQFPLTLHQIYNRMPHFIVYLITIPVLSRTVFVII